MELLQHHLHHATGFGHPYQLLPSIFTVRTAQCYSKGINFGSVEQTRSKSNWWNVVLEILQYFVKALSFCLGHFISLFSSIVSIIIKTRLEGPGEKMQSVSLSQGRTISCHLWQLFAQPDWYSWMHQRPRDHLFQYSSTSIFRTLSLVSNPNLFWHSLNPHCLVWTTTGMENRLRPSDLQQPFT